MKYMQGRSRPAYRPGGWTLAAIAGLIVLLAGLVAHAGSPAGRVTRAAAVTRPMSISERSGSLDPRIASLVRRDPDHRIEVIAEFRRPESAAQIRRDVARAGGRVVARLHIIPAAAVEISARRARLLAAEPAVVGVTLNSRIRTLGLAPTSDGGSQYGTALGDTFTQTLDAPALWREGATGSGIGVAVIDTGVDRDLPDFARTDGHGSRVIATAVTNPGATTADDTYGHGTFVAGIIAGNSNARSASDPLHDQFVGVAPDANIISVKVADDQGNATLLDVIYGLQFAVDFKDLYNIRVVNLSLDADTAESYTQDPLDAAVEAAWMHGLVVVAAAGNRGDAPDAVQYSPANDPYVITVGAVDENGTGNVSDDAVASWSSRGVTQDGFAKPDIDAPGAHIVSELAPGSAFASMCSTCIIDGQYIKASGTSFATPMISGLVADLLALHPSWTPDQVKGALTDPAVWSSPIPEVDAAKVAALDHPPLADQGLAPNTLISTASGSIDYSRGSWSRGSWSQAGFSRGSWSLAAGADGASVSRGSWSMMGWSGAPGS